MKMSHKKLNTLGPASNIGSIAEMGAVPKLSFYY